MSLVSKRAPPERRLFIGVPPGLKESDVKRFIFDAVTDVFGRPADKLVIDYHRGTDKRCVFISFKTDTDTTTAFEYLSDYRVAGPPEFLLRVERPHNYVKPTMQSPRVQMKTLPLAAHLSASATVGAVTTVTPAQPTQQSLSSTSISMSTSASISSASSASSALSAHSWMEKRMTSQVTGSSSDQNYISKPVHSPTEKVAFVQQVPADPVVVPCEPYEQLQARLSSTESRLQQQMDALLDTRRLLTTCEKVGDGLRHTVSELKTQLVQMEAQMTEQQRLASEAAHQICDLNNQLRMYQESDDTQRKIIDQLRIELVTSRSGMQNSSSTHHAPASASSTPNKNVSTELSAVRNPRCQVSLSPSALIMVRVIEPMTIITCGETAALHGTVRVVRFSQDYTHAKFFVVVFKDIAHAEQTLAHLHAFVQRLKPSNEQTALTPHTLSDVMYVTLINT